MDELILRLRRMLGYVPIGTVDLVKVLAHPDCIELTRNYLDAVDK